MQFLSSFKWDKTVLLRECKRHTDRHLSSTQRAVLYWGGGHPGWVPPWLGYPLPLTWWGSGVHWVGAPLAGVPPSWPGWGVPWAGTPWLGYPHPDLAGGYPGQAPPWLGYPPFWPGWGVPWVDTPWLGYPPSWPGWGVPWAGASLAGVLPIVTWPGGAPGGYPPGWGTRPPLVTWSGGYPRWVPPGWGTPHCDLVREVTLGGHPLAWVPHPRSDGGDTRGRYSQQGYPSSWTWLGYPPGWTWLGYTPCVDREMNEWMDRHVWKHYPPVVLRTRSVKIQLIQKTSCEKYFRIELTTFDHQSVAIPRMVIVKFS